jgi:hypothetical protein
MYVVIDKQTNTRANKTDYKTLKTASRAVDRLDQKHGGYRYNWMRLSRWIELNTPKENNVIEVDFACKRASNSARY